MAAGVVALAVVIWLEIGSKAPPTLVAEAESNVTGSDVKVVDAPTPSGERAGTEASSTRSIPSLTCTLRVRVECDGRPAKGHVSWIQSPDQRDLMAGLATSLLPGAIDDPTAHHVEIAGQADLEVRKGDWTWLRFRGSSGVPVFDRVAPVHSDTVHTISLPSQPRIHVQVLGPDWESPLPHARLRVHVGTLASSEVQPESGDRTADETGYLVLEDLPAGRVVLTTAGATPTDPPPQACSLVWGGSVGDLGVVLVQGEPRGDVTLSVLVAEGLVRDIAPKLYLTRIDGIRDRLVAQEGTLRPGLQDLRFQLSPGRYQVGVLPTGELEVDGGGVVDVSGRATNASISLSPRTERTAVHLLGPGISDPPLRVCIEAADGLRSDDPDMLFVGPFHWHATEATIPSFADPCIVTCVGRQRAFVTRRPVQLSGERVEIDLIPACCLAVEWLGGGGRDTSPVLVVEGDDWQIARPFERRLIHVPGGHQPALVGRLVVPLGHVRVEAVAGDHVRWTRECDAQARQLVLRIE